LCKDDIEQGSRGDDGRRGRWNGFGENESDENDGDRRAKKQTREEKKVGGQIKKAKVIDPLMHKVECHLFDKTFPCQRVGEQKVSQDEGEGAGQADAAGVVDAAGGANVAGVLDAASGADVAGVLDAAGGATSATDGGAAGGAELAAF